MKLMPAKAGPLLIAMVLAMGLPPTVTAQNITVVNMIPRSASNETNQDSEPNLAVNPANPLQMAGTAFTTIPPSVPCGTGNVPIYLSVDGGMTWNLCSIVPGSNLDITLRFSGTSNILYISWISSRFFFFLDTNILRVTPFPTPTGLTVLQSISKRVCIGGVCDTVDQPYVEATTVPAGLGTGSDRVYVGENDLEKSRLSGGNGDTASLNQSLDAATAAPPAGFNLPPLYVDARPPCNQDAPSVRPAVHSSGIVYAAFMHWSQCSPLTADVVVVRDDNWGAGSPPYSDLRGADTKPGVAVVSGVPETFASWCVGNPGPACLGTQRIGSALSIAVDPNNASNVWIAWGDGADAKHYTIHVRQSVDKGATWNGDLRTVTPATNPALAINSQGVIGFLYQKFVDPGNCARPPADHGTACWETHLETSSAGVPWSDRVLANTPDGPAQHDPSIGDYIHLLAVDKTLYGIFSANNFPVKKLPDGSSANFPQHVTYQRNVDFSAESLLDVNSASQVNVSVDPFFFSVTPDPCQGLVDATQALQDQIDALSNLLGDPGFTPATQQRIRKMIFALDRILRSDQAQLKQCQLQHP